MSESEELSNAVREWEAAVDARWREFRQSNRKGMKPFISIYSPKWTMNVDNRERERTRNDLMQWTVDHYGASGIAVKCIPDGYNTDGFTVEHA